MLGKFLAYELKTSGRQFMPMYLFYIVFSIVNMFFFESGFLRMIRNQGTPNAFSIISVIISCLYLFCMISIYVLTYVFLTMQFYRTTAGKQGYFTFSLPIKPSVILVCKIISAVFWQLVTSGLIVLSVYALCAVHDIKNWFSLFSQAFRIVYDYENYYQTFQILMVISMILSLFTTPLQIFTSIAIGQLFSKNRIAWSVCFYFVIYTILQVLGTILLVITNFTEIVIQFSQGIITSAEYAHYMILVMQGNLILAVLSIIVMYAVLQFVYSKKLNLI